MKKSVKIITSLVLAMVMIMSTVEMASAATSYSWTATKNPGTQEGATTVKMPLYKGTLVFKVTSLTGSCSYLLGKCTTRNYDLYYINNSARNVMITKVNGTQSFKMAFTDEGLKENNMYLKCSVEHNALYSDYVSASGTIYIK